MGPIQKTNPSSPACSAPSLETRDTLRGKGHRADSIYEIVVITVTTIAVNRAGVGHGKESPCEKPISTLIETLEPKDRVCDTESLNFFSFNHCCRDL